MTADAISGQSKWNEKRYLDRYPDVAAAVVRGDIPDGYTHYQLYGRNERRRIVAETRRCLEPWLNLDFKADGTLTPCCLLGEFQIGKLDDESFRDFRNNEKIRSLRHELLTGELNSICANCFVKPVCSIDELKSDIDYRGSQPEDRQDPLPLTSVRIHFTEDCNLRCTYCSLSLPWYKARTITRASAMKITEFLSSSPELGVLHVNGHGETTICDFWRESCETLLAQGHPICILSNLARLMNDDEIETLSKFQVVGVSIDSADATLLKKIRRRVDIRNIISNIALIRKAAAARGTKPPQFLFQCGLYDKNIAGILDYANFCVAMAINKVVFWQLDKQVHLDDPEIDVNSLKSLDPAALRVGLEEFDKAVTRLTDAGIDVDVAGLFVDDLRRQSAA